MYYFLIAIIAIIFIISFYTKSVHVPTSLIINSNKKEFTKRKEDVKPLIFKEIFKNVIVTSVHYDERFKSLRLIVSNHKRSIPNLSCTYKYNNKSETCVINYVPYNINFKDHGHILVPVSMDKYPDVLIINNVAIPVPKPLSHKKEYELSVCISRTVNYVAVNRVIQTIESYRYYGVEHFTIYKTNASKEVEKVFDYYEGLGLMEVVTWNPNYEFSINEMDYGYIYKLNDCLYRNMYKSKSLIVTDWDEIIIPKKHDKILDIANKKYRDKYNWYEFRSFMFHTELYGKVDYNINNVPDADIYSYRQYCIFKKGILSKNLYTNLSVLYEIEIHYVGHGEKDSVKQINVDIEEGYIRHTRRVQKYNELMEACETKWLKYPIDVREKKIEENVKLIQNELNIIYPPKVNPIIF